MKRILASILFASVALAQFLPLGIVSSGPELDQVRDCTIGTNTFLVKYRLWSTSICTIPAVAGAKPHYPCNVTVVLGTNEIAKFEGQWIPGGCFEDNPFDLVNKALLIASTNNPTASKK